MIFIEADLNKDLNGSSKHTCDLEITKKESAITLI